MGKITNIDIEKRIVTGVLLDLNSDVYSSVKDKIISNLLEVNKNHKNNPYIGGIGHLRDDKGMIHLAYARTVTENVEIKDGVAYIDIKFLPVPESNKIFEDIRAMKDAGFAIPLAIKPVISNDGTYIGADLVPHTVIPSPKSSFIANRRAVNSLIADVSSLLTSYMAEQISYEATQESTGKLIHEFVCEITGKNINPDDIKMEFKIEHENVILVPDNFLNALWAMGVGVTAEELYDKDTYDDDIALYKWNKDTKSINIQPKMGLYSASL